MDLIAKPSCFWKRRKCFIVASIPSIIAPGETKAVCTSGVYRVLKYPRPHKFLGLFLLLNGQYSYRIDKFMNWSKISSANIARELCQCAICKGQCLFAIMFFLSQNCHKVAVCFIALFIYLYRAAHLAIKIADVTQTETKSISRKKERRRRVKELILRNVIVVVISEWIRNRDRPRIAPCEYLVTSRTCNNQIKFLSHKYFIIK